VVNCFARHVMNTALHRKAETVVQEEGHKFVEVVYRE
jgi:hypothetical protein